MDPLYFESWQHEDVTLATQCSANHLHHVIELAKRWSGKAIQQKPYFGCIGFLELPWVPDRVQVEYIW